MAAGSLMMRPEQRTFREARMVEPERWAAIHREAGQGQSVSAIARQFDLDRKAVRRCLREPAWEPYQRMVRPETVLAVHATYLQDCVPVVG